MFEINGEYVEFDIIIRQGNNHNPTDNPIISVLHWNNLSPVEGIRQFEITLDIDSTYKTFISSTDKISKKTSYIQLE